MTFEKPINRTERGLPLQIQALYDGVDRLIDQLNASDAVRATAAAYVGSTASGTVPIGDDILGGHIYLAVIGGIPTLAVRHEGTIAARGGNADEATALSASVAGRRMTFTATDVLQALYVIL